MFFNFGQSLFQSLPGEKENISYFNKPVWLAVMVSVMQASLGIYHMASSHPEAVCAKHDSQWEEYVPSPSCQYKFMYYDDTYKYLMNPDYKIRNSLHRPGIAYRNMDPDMIRVLGHWDIFPITLLVAGVCGLIPVLMFRVSGEKNTLTNLLEMRKLKDDYKKGDGDCDLTKKYVTDLQRAITYAVGNSYAIAHIKADVAIALATLLQIVLYNIFLNNHFVSLGYDLYMTRNTAYDLGHYLFPKGNCHVPSNITCSSLSCILLTLYRSQMPTDHYWSIREQPG